MSFDLKHIQEENIDIKKVIPVAILFVVGIIGSLIFVYYYFTFEKNSIMQKQYLGAKSQIRESYKLKEKIKIENLDIKSSKKIIIRAYDR